jgi:hypothetical protein
VNKTKTSGKHSRLFKNNMDQRKYKLLDRKTRARLPKLDDRDEVNGESIAKAHFSFYIAGHSKHWYACQFDGKNVFKGLVVNNLYLYWEFDGDHYQYAVEIEEFYLNELLNLRDESGNGVTRDDDFSPMSLEEIEEGHKDYSNY